MLAIAEPRARDPKPTVSIVPHGTDLFFAYFPALRTGLLSSGPCPEADISFGAYGTDFL
jgi:hypothetical protein